MEEYLILRFKHCCVKMDCFGVFIFLTFLSDVIVNGANCAISGTIVVAIKPRKINCGCVFLNCGQVEISAV